MNWRIFLETLGAAAAGGAMEAVAQKMGDGGPLNGKAIGVTAAAGALIGIVNLLRKPPKKAEPEPQDSPKS